MTGSLLACLTKALDEVCPEKEVRIMSNTATWWTPELSQVRNEVKKLQNRSFNSTESYHAFVTHRKLYTRMIRRAKKKSWQDFCSKTEDIRETSRIMKILKPNPKQGVSLFKVNGKLLSPEATLRNLMDTHFLESEEFDEDKLCKAVPIKVRSEDDERFLNFIDADKVGSALASFGPLKAAGPDQLKPIVLHKIDARTLEYVTEIYKRAVQRRMVPRQFLEMSVVFIPKQGKDSYDNAKSYRPITLSNFLLKGLERIIQWYILDYCVREPLFAQHAYTVGRSCDSALSDAVDFIERHVLRGKHVLGVSLDCSGAFDRIKFGSAKTAMLKKNIPECIVDIYCHMLENRKVSATLQGENVAIIPKRGSPQGGVLSPLIWNLIMDTILLEFRTGPVKVVGYADDVLLLTAGLDEDTVLSNMNGALKKVLRWGETNGLAFNPSKTTCVRFTRSKRLKPWKKIRMDGTRVPYSDDMKYLGVTLDKCLNWGHHVKERTNKAIKTMSLANAAVGQKWGLTTQKIFWIYQALVRPIVTYGSLVWSHALSKMSEAALEKVQRKAILCMSSCMRSTPTKGAEVVLGLPPLLLHAQQLATNARLRTRNILSLSWDGIGSAKMGHQRHHDGILSRNNLLLPTDNMLRQRVWERNDEIDPLTAITVYTDGSKTTNGTGCGWAAFVGDTVVEESYTNLGKDATVFQAEVTAVEQALCWAKTEYEDADILIKSDSQSAIQAILGRSTDSRTVASCIRMLKMARENQRIALSWVRGHADNTGNEFADYLAKAGANLNVQTVGPELPLSVAEIKRRLKTYYEVRWQKAWESLDSCRQTKQFLPKVGVTQRKHLMQKSRSEINLILQAFTGHALVAHHLMQWQEGVEDQCALCLEDEESTHHLWRECPALEMTRRESILKRDIFGKVLSFFKSPTLRRLFETRASEIQ